MAPDDEKPPINTGSGGHIGSLARLARRLTSRTTKPLRVSASSNRQREMDEHSHKYNNNTKQSYAVTAGAVSAPFILFCLAHQLNYTEKILTVVYRRVGVFGFFFLPFITLGMEKSIYDTVQAMQGIEAHVDLDDGERVRSFPSGGSNLPSFSLVDVKKWRS